MSRVDRYTTKRTLLRPLTAWRRWRAGRLGPINRAVWEAQDYRPAMRRFFHAMRADPDLLVGVDLDDGAVVLDVGAYEGDWSRQVLRRVDERGGAAVTIHAFEPEPGVVERCLRAVDADPRVEVHPYGLARRDDRVPLAMGGPGSSVYVNPKVPASLGTTEVELRDVDAVLTALRVDRVDLVKVNIEGGEYDLIDRLHETGWLARVGPVIVQFHEFAPDAHRRRRRNRRQLAATHRCTWCYPWVYERWDPR
jgi:FkbM family methyltransferase